MATAKIFWTGRSQAVRLPKDFRFPGDEVRIRRHGNAVILEPVADDWAWLDGIAARLDADFVAALDEEPPQQERPALDDLFPLMRYMLDTNAVIALLNSAVSAPAKRARREKPDDIAISAIVAHELFHAAFKSRHAGRNVGIVDALRFAVLEFDREDARQAGEVRAFLAGQGTPIGPYDALIAGQAIARNLILVTHYTHEFGRVPRLRIEDWEQS